MTYHKKSKEFKLTKKQKAALKSAKNKLLRKIEKLEKAAQSKIHHRKHARSSSKRKAFSSWF